MIHKLYGNNSVLILDSVAQKSPFLKGDLGGFAGSYPNPPWPPFKKGGKKTQDFNAVLTMELHFCTKSKYLVYLKS
jgi:hypothetical protein